MKNKKGDIPITILVMGIIAVCVLTIFSFYFDVSKQKESFVGAGLIETIYSVQEEGLNSFEEEGVKISFGDEIVASYISTSGWVNKKEKTLIEIKYTP